MKQRDLKSEPLTSVELEKIRNMLMFARVAPVVIAEMFHVTVKEILTIQKALRWSRVRQLHNVAAPGHPECLWSVAEIAAYTGLKRQGVHFRLSQGLTGPALLAKPYRAPRKPHGSQTAARLTKVRGQIKPEPVRKSDRERGELRALDAHFDKVMVLDDGDE